MCPPFSTIIQPRFADPIHVQPQLSRLQKDASTWWMFKKEPEDVVEMVMFSVTRSVLVLDHSLASAGSSPCPNLHCSSGGPPSDCQEKNGDHHTSWVAYHNFCGTQSRVSTPFLCLNPSQVTAGSCMNLIRINRIVQGALESQDFVSTWGAEDRAMALNGRDTKSYSLPAADEAIVILLEFFHSRNTQRKDPLGLPGRKNLSENLRITTVRYISLLTFIHVSFS